MKSWKLIVLSCLAPVSLTCQDIATGQAESRPSLFPASGQIVGWNRLDPPEEYTGDQLYDLIDGGADLYFEYGFSKATSGQLADERKNIVQVEIYEMEDDSAAFGIFSITHHRSGPRMLDGMEVMEGSDFISLRKNNCFVNIAWVSKQDKSLPDLAGIAGTILDMIPSSDTLPGLVRHLAGKEEISQLAYFSGNIGLSNLYYFDYRDIFGAVVGIHCLYKSSQMILFRYDSVEKSTEAASAVKAGLMNSKRFSDFGMVYQGFDFIDNKGNQLCCIRHGNLLAVQVSPPGEPATPSNIMQFLDVYHRK